MPSFKGKSHTKMTSSTLIWQNKVSQSGHFKKDIIASIVKTKIMHFSIMINISLQYVYGRVHLSFLFEKILSYKIYIGMTCLQYVYAHVYLSIPPQKIFSHKFSVMINSSLQYVCGRLHLSFLFEKILSCKIYIGLFCLQYS